MKTVVSRVPRCSWVLGLGLLVQLVGVFKGGDIAVRADLVVNVCNEAQLRAALSSGGRVQLACDGRISLTDSLVIATNTILDATGQTVVLDGNNAVRVFRVLPNVQFTLIGLQIRHGRADIGGALYSTHAQVDIQNCLFEANHALGTETPYRSGAGGALYCEGGQLRVLNSRFRTNLARVAVATGGAVATVSGRLSFRDCAFESNSAEGFSTGGSASGGAVADIGGGILEFDRCTFDANEAVGAGGFRNGPGGPARGGAISCSTSLRAADCSFTNNEATGGGGQSFYGGDGTGGALYIEGSAVVTDCQFSHNQAGAGRGVANQVGGGESGDSMGGAVFNAGELQVTGSSFAWNQVAARDVGGAFAPPPGKSFGGAFYSTGDCALTNVTCWENRAVAQAILLPPPLESIYGAAGGAAIYHASNLLTLTHCTIASNAVLFSAGTAAAALHVSSNGIARLSASILVGNSNAAVTGVLTDLGSNLASDASAPLVHPSSRTNVTLQLGTFDYHGASTLSLGLLPNSPAIDLVDPTLGPLTDQRGVPRPIGPRSDAGAYEFVPEPAFQVAAGGGLELVRTLRPLEEYRFESSADLASWMLLVNARSDEQGRVRVTDRSAGDQPGRFYRVVIAPTILRQPQGRTLRPRGTLTLTTLAAGTGPLHYQWQRDGINLAGGTNSTFTLQAVQPSDAGSYAVEVSNTAGSVLSAPATVIIDVSPPIAPALVEPPPRQLTIPEGAQGTLTVIASGTEPLRYQWRNTGLDISGATNSTLVISNTFYGAGAGSYSVVVSNEAGTITSEPSHVEIFRAQGPTILQQPQSLTVRQGETAVFTVKIDDRWPAWYSWVFNGRYVEDATGPTLVIENVQPHHSGSYQADISNAAGSTSSAEAVLRVEPATPPQ